MSVNKIIVVVVVVVAEIRSLFLKYAPQLLEVLKLKSLLMLVLEISSLRWRQAHIKFPRSCSSITAPVEQWRSIWCSCAQSGFSTAQVYRPQVTHHKRVRPAYERLNLFTHRDWVKSHICYQVLPFWYSANFWTNSKFQAEISTNYN